jgi:hypothetical protein
MILAFIHRYITKRDQLRDKWLSAPPKSYFDIVRSVIELVTVTDGGIYAPDPDRITQIDDGDVQGTELYIIGEKGYQPQLYYSVKIAYGSCAVTDTFISIEENDSLDNEHKVEAYLSLALHIVQAIRRIKGKPVDLEI